jgi:hypothetical protein
VAASISAGLLLLLILDPAALPCPNGPIAYRNFYPSLLMSLRPLFLAGDQFWLARASHSSAGPARNIAQHNLWCLWSCGAQEQWETRRPEFTFDTCRQQRICKWPSDATRCARPASASSEFRVFQVDKAERAGCECKSSLCDSC